MLFNSNVFLFGFLPACLVGFYALAKIDRRLAKIYLLLSSIVFYSWSNIQGLPLLAGSILFNYYVGGRIQKLIQEGKNRTGSRWCSFGVFVNVAVLVYFKYTDFLLENVNSAFG